MAISVAHLVGTVNDADQDSYSSGNYTPSISEGWLATFFTTSHGSLIAPYGIVSTAGLKWKEVQSFLWSSSAQVRRTALWVAKVDASPGTISTLYTMIDDGGGNTSGGALSASLAYTIFEVSGCNYYQLIHALKFYGSTYNPSSQTSSNTCTLTLDSAADTDNRTLSYHLHRQAQATTPTSGFSELMDTTGSTPAAGQQLQWHSSAFQTVVDANWTTAANNCLIGVELSEAASTKLLASYPISGQSTITPAAGTSVTCRMPAGILYKELLLAWVTADGNTSIAASSGWTELFSTVNGTECRHALFAKLADGVNPNTWVNTDALTITLGSSVDSTVWIARVTDHGVTNILYDIKVGTTATGTNANPDPPNVVIPNSDDWCIFASAGSDDDDNVGAGATWAPTSYNELAQVESAVTTTSCFLQVAYRRLNTASDQNPGTFTLVGSEGWVAGTIAVPSAKPQQIWGMQAA